MSVSTARPFATNLLQQVATQTAHGFTIQQMVRFDGTDWVLSQADSQTNAELMGMVTAVNSADSFTLTQQGYTDGLAGLVAGTLYFLSTTSAGDLTVTMPTTLGQVIVPCFFAVSTTSGFIFAKPGQTGMVPLLGGTMTGFLTLNADPVTALQAVTKQYADAIAAGFTVKQAVVAASTVALTATYANGAAGVGATLTNAGAMAAFALDGISLSVNDRVLIKNQASALENGIYTVTTVGSGAVNWVLTRALDYDTPAEIQPGNLVLVNTGSTQAQSSWIETATVTTIGVDDIDFSQFTASPTTFANVNLTNLASTAVNVTVNPGVDDSIDLGAPLRRWQNIYGLNFPSGPTAADTLSIDGYNDVAITFTEFFLVTTGNPPTASLHSSVTATTQVPGTNTTQLATTAFVAALGALKANVELNNLTGVAINTSLISDTDVTDNLGSQAIRWNNVYTATLQTGDTAADTLIIGAWDVDGAATTPFITLTANNTPTCSFAGTITGVTQAALNNSTLLATTAYVDNATGGGAGAPANATFITQVPNATLTNEQALSLLTTGIMKSTTATGVVSIAAAGTDYVDPATTITVAGTANEITSSAGAQDLSTNRTWTLSLPAALTFTGKTVTGGALSGVSATTFTFTTGTIGTAVTGVTQVSTDNTTLMATTAFVQSAIAGASGFANTALSNLAAVAINTTLVSDTDNTDDLGSATVRWNDLFATAIKTGSGAGNTTIISAHDVDGASDTAFITLTANNTPTCVLSGAVTGTTQAPGTNDTTLSTTAYSDAIGALKANAATTITVAGTANEITSSAGAQDLSANRTWTLSLPAALTFTGKTVTGGALSGVSATTFTFTTGSIGTAVTAVTQTAGNNSTLVATTAFVTAAVAGGGGLPAATQAEMETATSTTTAVTPGRTQYHPGVAKFWINANGAGTAVNASHNVTSITDTNTGRLTVTIATDFSSADYAVVTSIASNGSGAAVLCHVIRNATIAAGSVEIDSYNTGGTNADPVESYYAAGFGDQ